MITIETLRERIAHALPFAEQDVRGFAEKLTSHANPAYLFQWADSVVRAAARVSVLQEALAAIEKGATVEQIMDAMREQLVRGMAFPPSSTSPMSNLSETYVLAERAQFLQKYGG